MADPRRKVTVAGESGRHDFCGAKVKIGLGLPIDRRKLPAEEVGEAHRRFVPSFGQCERSHPLPKNATRTGVSAGVGQRHRTGQEELAGCRSRVAGASDQIPREGQVLPFVEQDPASVQEPVGISFHEVAHGR